MTASYTAPHCATCTQNCQYHAQKYGPTLVAASQRHWSQFCAAIYLLFVEDSNGFFYRKKCQFNLNSMLTYFMLKYISTSVLPLGQQVHTTVDISTTIDDRAMLQLVKYIAYIKWICI